MKIIIAGIILLFVVNINVNCQTQATFNPSRLRAGYIYTVEKEYDLSGKSIVFPENVVLKFGKGGVLKNGKLTGEGTRLEGSLYKVFDNVEITGKWNIEHINTNMFRDLTAVNSLKNVVALTSPYVNNVLTIMPGTYWVAAKNGDRKVLAIPSNTEVVMNGEVIMEPNRFAVYDVFTIEGNNIFIHGTGTVRGDKFTHLGDKYEWGMGISILKCHNVRVYDLRIEQCWGDCIYIDEYSTNIHINNCILDNGRRQGISVISGDEILIENCYISNVFGIAPQYAIDVEPDKGKSIGSVVIRNVTVNNCVGGIMSWGSAENASIRSIEVYDCYVEGTDKTKNGVPYSFNKTDTLTMNNCHSDIGKKTNLSKMKVVDIQ